MNYQVNYDLSHDRYAKIYDSKIEKDLQEHDKENMYLAEKKEQELLNRTFFIERIINYISKKLQK